MDKVIVLPDGSVIDVAERERSAFERGQDRGQSDEGQDYYNPSPLSGEWAGESVQEILGDLWSDIYERSSADVPEWFIETIEDHFEQGYRDAFEDRSFCDECACLISALDGIATDSGLAFCGSFRGNGCGDRLIAEGKLPR